MLRVIAFVPHPPAGASSRYRVYQMIPHLERHGVRLEPRALLDASGFARLYLPGGVPGKLLDLGRGLRRRLAQLEEARRFPLALVHREAWPVIGFAPDRWMERRGVRWVFDFDDAVFLPNVSGANRLFARLKPFGQPARLAAGAAAVSAGNAWLADWARRERPGRLAGSVAVIPSAVDIEAWKPRPRDPGPPRLAWIGSGTTVEHLASIAPAIERLQRRHPDLELHVVGAAFSHPGIRVVVHPWSLDTEAAVVARCDVGLSPLSDSDWSRGKCGLKQLLYMALGLPAVASAVGVHLEIVRHGENGLLAPTADGFEPALEALIDDPGLRERLGRAGRETVEACYSLQAVAPRLAALLQRAAESGDP
jgi:glycosyltransferase involved in cell wall biosynthesis